MSAKKLFSVQLKNVTNSEKLRVQELKEKILNKLKADPKASKKMAQILSDLLKLK